MTGRSSSLDDFGARGTVTAEERHAEYQEQCKGLPQKKQARFWREVLMADPEVAKIVGFHASKRGRRG